MFYGPASPPLALSSIYPTIQLLATLLSPPLSQLFLPLALYSRQDSVVPDLSPLGPDPPPGRVEETFPRPNLAGEGAPLLHLLLSPRRIAPTPSAPLHGAPSGAARADRAARAAGSSPLDTYPFVSFQRHCCRDTRTRRGYVSRPYPRRIRVGYVSDTGYAPSLPYPCF